MHRQHRVFRRSVEVSITVNVNAFLKKVQKTLIFSLPCTVFATVLRFHRNKFQRKELILLIL